jgi:hypothetical protein
MDCVPELAVDTAQYPSSSEENGQPFRSSYPSVRSHLLAGRRSGVRPVRGAHLLADDDRQRPVVDELRSPAGIHEIELRENFSIPASRWGPVVSCAIDRRQRLV